MLIKLYFIAENLCFCTWATHTCDTQNNNKTLIEVHAWRQKSTKFRRVKCRCLFLASTKKKSVLTLLRSRYHSIKASQLVNLFRAESYKRFTACVLWSMRDAEQTNVSQSHIVCGKHREASSRSTWTRCTSQVKLIFTFHWKGRASRLTWSKLIQF